MDGEQTRVAPADRGKAKGAVRKRPTRRELVTVNGKQPNQYSGNRKVVRKAADDTKFRRLTDNIPHDEMNKIMQASDDPRVEILYGLFNNVDPLIRRMSVPEICKRAGISYTDFLRMVTMSRIDEGLLRMSGHMPKVLEDTAIDAESKIVTCPECYGKMQVAVRDKKGKLTGEVVTCFVCDGTGKLRKSGDADARKLAFEAMGLTNKSRGAFININTANGQIASVEDDLESASRILDMPPLTLPEKTP